MVVSGEAERHINPDKVRNLFLGLNDGLVEILGAVSGFFAAFRSSTAVLAAGSEAELRATEDGRRRFLGETVPSEAAESPMASALVVGIGYFAGAVVPVLPVLFGATGLLPTIVTAGAMIVAVSAIVAFISGMAVPRRIVLNLIITGIAVVVTYGIGLLAKAMWGIAV